MAITINRSPVTVDGNYKDEGQYFNQTQFKGLCSNQNVDSIDPNTFSDVENLYIDSDNTLASRPKLKTHDNFGFTSIEKMWIWDDVHLIHGEKTVDNNSVVLISDVHNPNNIISLTLTEKVNQLIRVENRIYIFLETKVYVYEDNIFTEITVTNIQDYFYIPNNKVIANGLEQEGESKNELTPLTKTAVTAKEAKLFNLNIPDGKEVTFKIAGVNYTLTWAENASYLTLGSPYITKIFDQVTVVENGTAMGILDNKLYYSFDGVIWESLPNPDPFNVDFIGKFGLSKDGKFAWVVLLKTGGANDSVTGSDGLYIISLVATEYNTGEDPEEVSPTVKKYPTWRRIITPEYSIYAHYAISVDMISYDRYVAFFKLTPTYTAPPVQRYLLVAAEGLDNQGKIKQYTRREDISWDRPDIVEARVFATERIWGPSGNYLDCLFIKRSGKSLQISPITYGNSTLGNLNQNSPFSDTTNIGNMFFNISDESKWYDCSNLETMDVLFTETVDDMRNPQYPEYSNNPEVPDYVDPALKDEDGHYIFSSNTICITYVATINKKDGNVSQPENAYSRTVIADGTKMIRPDDTHFGYFNYDNFEVHLITTNTIYQSVKFKMRDRHTILCRYGLIKDGNLYPLAIPMVKDIGSNTPGWPDYPYQTLPGSYPNWGTPYGLGFVNSDYLVYERDFVDNSVLLFSDNLTAFYVNNQVFTNPFSTMLEATYYPEDVSESNLWTGLFPKHNVETDNTQYWSFNQTLYIESRRYTEDFKPLLYFPEINTEIRPRQITNLLVIDRGIVALFNDYEVWYVTKVTLEDSKISYGYAYYKSRIGLGCKEGADIDIMYDGATITYASPRGIVGMNYQQLTQNTDQILSFLSDNITDAYFPFYGDGKIKIFKYKFWVVFYKENSYKCLILDLRNTSWWVWDSKIDGGFKEIYLYKDEPLVLDNNGHLMSLDTTHTGIYKDLDLKTIDWKATSQPLGFGAINNYKRINSININSVQLTKEPFNYILICRNYKNQKNIYAPKVVNFEQEKITVGNYRTFVKRLNYIQSVKFQYTVANNSDLPIQTPISITAISTKYEIKGRVR